MSFKQEEPTKTEKTAQQRNMRERLNWHNLDYISIGSLFSAGILGLITLANNVRYNFWNSFIKGFGEIKTPFEDITKTHTEVFTNIVAQRNSGEITPTHYSNAMRANAANYRNAVADRLLKDYNIPTHGLKGWTIGTWKRFKELGVTSRIHSGIGVASITSTAIGAILLLRHNRHTVDRIEHKIDEGHARGR